MIQVPGQDLWYSLYHRRPLGETTASHRLTRIDRLFFDAADRIQPVRITAGGVMEQPLVGADIGAGSCAICQLRS